MADFKNLSDVLAEEVMSDVADTFFGARIDIDDALEYFHTVSEKLHEKLYKVFRAYVLLEKISLGSERLNDFWKTTGISSDPFKIPPGIECAGLLVTPTFSLFARNEYIKWYGMAYDLLRERINEYMHGTYKDDSNGRKILSANRDDFFRMCNEINIKIEKINRNVSASEVLKFTKSLDPSVAKKENITGCVGPQCKAIDDEMAFTVITIKDIDFPAFSDLPDRKEVKSFISGLCSANYSREKSRVKELLKSLRQSVK
ncbi:hypothetical protein [Maridesulfovibrio zosterae]|uniref:hypothetical protein n=1 Tax=Maridesulfovibrio zosterae TaxID=82171 RepID=UPI00040F6DB4|nr:hypothetical protein [Maridesulfovibrio zosterae]